MIAVNLLISNPLSRQFQVSLSVNGKLYSSLIYQREEIRFHTTSKKFQTLFHFQGHGKPECLCLNLDTSKKMFAFPCKITVLRRITHLRIYVFWTKKNICKITGRGVILSESLGCPEPIYF